MKHVLGTCIVLLVLLLAPRGLSSGLPAGLREQGANEVKLGGLQALTLVDSKTQAKVSVPVALSETEYSANIPITRDGKTKDWGGTLFCYELKSKDSKVQYTWSVWSTRTLSGFRLVGNDAGEHYLTWLDSYAVFFAEVSKPTDRAVRLKQLQAADDQSSRGIFLPVATVVGRGCLVADTPPFNAEAEVISISRDKAGEWVVMVTGPKCDKPFTIVSSKRSESGWRLVTGESESDDNAVAPTCTPAGLKQVGEARRMPLRGKQALTLTGPEKRTKGSVSVELAVAAYSGSIPIARSNGTSKQWQGNLLCYELRSKDVKIPHTWSVWSSANMPLGEFQLLAGDGGENYLAWIDRTRVRFAEVSRPVDSCARLADWQSAPGRSSGHVSVAIVPLPPDLDRAWVDPFTCAIEVVSISKGKAGEWVVVVTGPKSDKLYTIVTDKHSEYGWRLASEEPKPVGEPKAGTAAK